MTEAQAHAKLRKAFTAIREVIGQTVEVSWGASASIVVLQPDDPIPDDTAGIAPKKGIHNNTPAGGGKVILA
jgi:hypothetical protein